MKLQSTFLSVIMLAAFIDPALAQHYYYTPNTIHNPVLIKKNDVSAGIGMGWGSDFSAVEAQGVYSPVQYGAVMVNGFASGPGSVRNNEEVGANFRFLELGIGAYHPLERGSASIFAGVGQGDLYNYYGLDNFSQFTVRRYFLQPGLMYEDKYFRCGLALRLSRISYPKGESSFDIDEFELAAIRKIEAEAPFFMPELGLSGSILLSPCVVSINLTSVFPDAAGLNYSRFTMNLMLTFEFAKMGKKEKGKKKG
ncbi:MAG TPA: hypothetical protein PK228_12990 [Saprospiraceae bacterium]|nr:hypothetical protein [Saprospiraceae bacterium]